MKAAIHALEPLGHFDDKKLDRARLFQADQKTDQMYDGADHQNNFEIRRIDEHNHPHNRVDYEVHVAHAQNHRGTR